MNFYCKAHHHIKNGWNGYSLSKRLTFRLVNWSFYFYVAEIYTFKRNIYIFILIIRYSVHSKSIQACIVGIAMIRFDTKLNYVVRSLGTRVNCLKILQTCAILQVFENTQLLWLVVFLIFQTLQYNREDKQYINFKCFCNSRDTGTWYLFYFSLNVW